MRGVWLIKARLVQAHSIGQARAVGNCFQTCHTIVIIVCYSEAMSDDVTFKSHTRTKPPHSTVSTVLNGLGNGAMVGGGIWAVPEAVARFVNPKHAFPHNYFRATMISATVGAAIGTYFSLHEAKAVNEFQAALAQKVDALYADKHQHAGAQR